MGWPGWKAAPAVGALEAAAAIIGGARHPAATLLGAAASRALPAALARRWVLHADACRRSANLGGRIILTCAANRSLLPSFGHPAAERDSATSARDQGFVAKPVTLADGTQDLLNWEVVIPGKDGTIWDSARIPMTM